MCTKIDTETAMSPRWLHSRDYSLQMMTDGWEATKDAKWTNPSVVWRIPRLGSLLLWLQLCTRSVCAFICCHWFRQRKREKCLELSLGLLFASAILAYVYFFPFTLYNGQFRAAFLKMAVIGVYTTPYVWVLVQSSILALMFNIQLCAGN